MRNFWESSIVRAFHPVDDRRNVHELDKFIGLAWIFRAAMSGPGVAAYLYMSSARDALNARGLSRSQPRRLI